MNRFPTRALRRPAPARAAATLAVAVLALASVAACGSSNSSKSGSGGGGGSGSGGAYNIGSTSDLSAELAFEGTGLRDGINSWVKYTNSHGGIDGHMINYAALDDTSNPTTGLANAKQLTSKNVSAILGWGLSNVIVSALPALQHANTPIIAQSLTSDQLSPPQSLIYGGDFTIAGEAAPEVAFAKTLLQKANVSAPKAAIIGYVSTVDAQFRANAQKLVKGNGWTVSTTQVVQLSDTDITSAVQQVANSKPDVVISSLVDPQVLLLVRGLRQAGIEVPVINYDGGSAFGTLQTLADPNVYLLRPFGYGTDDSAGIKTYDAATAAAGVKPNAPFVINGYTQGLALGAALKKCGYPCPSSALVKALGNLGSVDTGGVTVAPLSYTPSSHEGVTAGVMYRWDATANKPAQASGPLPVSP